MGRRTIDHLFDEAASRMLSAHPEDADFLDTRKIPESEVIGRIFWWILETVEPELLDDIWTAYQWEVAGGDPL